MSRPLGDAFWILPRTTCDLAASIALAHDLTLVTHNAEEFSRVTRLRVEDWFER
jgi:hypothetical protein